MECSAERCVLYPPGTVCVSRLTVCCVRGPRSVVRWDEVCLSLPAFIYWLLLGWCDGQVSQEQVQAVVDNMNRQWACLSVCVVVFLNSVLQVSAVSSGRRAAGRRQLPLGRV